MQNLTVDFSELLVSHRHRNSARKLGALFAIGLFLQVQRTGPRQPSR